MNTNSSDAKLYYDLRMTWDPDLVVAESVLGTENHQLPEGGNAAREFARVRAESGQHVYQHIFAKFCLVGLFGTRCEELARLMCEQSAAAGYAPAIYMYASFYDMGWGGQEQNVKKAFHWIKRAADLEYPPALTALGIVSEESAKNEATKYYEQAAEFGYPPAQYRLGQLLLQDTEVDAGMKWLKSSSNAGEPGASSHLSMIYQHGLHGQRQDVGLAEQYRKRALSYLPPK